MKTLLLLIGLLVLAAGLFFVGQGSGLIQWPAESFMISQIRWVYYGARHRGVWGRADHPRATVKPG